MLNNRSKVFFGFYLFCVLATCFASLTLLPHVFTGDTPSYIEAMHVIQGGTVPPNFVPNRILTSSLGIEFVSIFSQIFGSVEVGWTVMNLIMFLVLSIVFYKLVSGIFKSEKTALVASLFLVTNYVMVAIALGYGMDIGGWMFYILSLYLTFKYIQTGDRKMLLYSALAVGVGGLFKEYAFLAVVPIAAVLIEENWRSPVALIKRGIVPMVIAIVPILIAHLFVLLKFRYTYIDWLSYNNVSFVYVSKVTEYIKSFGSLYTFLAFAVLGGVYCFIRYRKEILPEDKLRFFVISVAISALPVFIWQAITQRILFITVPAAILVASFAFKKYEKYWLWFFLLLGLYILVNFNMDKYILPNVNISWFLSKSL